ncbi:hypothetical protein C8J57DRAFT_1735284 [Mycena rebaudengoi]|nr:hypothetical protein C8J57DRAFT_1735284 [Mycena rebaudengoi]
MSLPDGIYLISNARAPIVLDLCAHPDLTPQWIEANETRMWESGMVTQAWKVPPGDPDFVEKEDSFLSKLWIVKSTGRKDLQTYTICNLRFSTYINIRQRNDVMIVTGCDLAAPGNNQEWEFIKVGLNYRIKNVKWKASLNLDSGKDETGTPIIGWGDSDTPNQLWNLKAYSVTYDDILTALQDSPYAMEDFKYYPDNTLYFVVPKPVLTKIWKTTGLGEKQNRSQIFAPDDFAIAFKAAVNDWAYSNIKADKLTPLCGIIVGESPGPEYHAYNWVLNMSDNSTANSVLFFFPKNGVFYEKLDRLIAIWGLI